jgi:hypothetical protein
MIEINFDMLVDTIHDSDMSPEEKKFLIANLTNLDRAFKAKFGSSPSIHI